VPQGSILGPVVFNLFIYDVFQLATHNVEIYLYADDTAIILSADTNHDLQILINNFFVTFYNWCTNNCTGINQLKSNYLLSNSSNITVSIIIIIIIKKLYLPSMAIHAKTQNMKKMRCDAGYESSLLSLTEQ
jgi:hypothetical protein